MIAVLFGALFAGLFGPIWVPPLGILLFFWHWERLILYHIDYKDGLIPSRVSLATYLSVFFTPGQFANWNWGVTIGLGYAYTVNNFLRRDKNELILGGLRLWALSLVYILSGDRLYHDLLDFLNARGVVVFDGIRKMACHFAGGGNVATHTVLLTSLLDLLSWLFLWGGVVHFKVGLWKICGYDIDPYFDRPWLATNLVSLWARFGFHYREFLVRAFYYPVFFRLAGNNPMLRIVAATMAAACFGNLVWGHISETLYYRGLAHIYAIDMVRGWPYFVLLALGISASELWLLRKKNKTRKPWTLDRKIVADILSAYATLQFYALIHIFFYRCPTATLWDHFRLFLAGFGIHL